MSHYLSDYDYHLPEARIAQEPLTPRDASRLLVYERVLGGITHAKFKELGQYLAPGSLLLLNDTRVLPARLFGKKPSGAAIELLLIRKEQSAPSSPSVGEGSESLSLAPQASTTVQPQLGRGEVWQCLMKSKGLQKGAVVYLDETVQATLLDDNPMGVGVPVRRVLLEAKEGVSEALHRLGQMPLPPYIQRGLAKESDKERYQTVFAKNEGSCAAPTAGLHFTSELLASLKEQQIETAYVTLHVGPGTFLPVKEEDTSKHKMHEEFYEISQETVDKIKRAKAEGRKVVAVGTTVVRTIESATKEDGSITAGSGETALFIRPGYTFRVIEQLITNFHLPKSTLLMLVSAFGGRAGVLAAYEEAIKEEYRFFSYGDAMLLR
jgi:S-adenosylmethionine:tRNA ribosyltransferase-isomerase